MKRIYRKQLATPEAQAELALVVDLVEQGRRVCLLCLEADPEICHRGIVAAAVGKRVPVTIVNLDAASDEG